MAVKTEKKSLYSLKETLKTLNKLVEEDNLFDLASNKDRESFDVKFISTGSPFMDSKVRGIGLGRMTLITGRKGSGKSSLACIFTKQYQLQCPDKIVVYMDGERTIDNSALDRFEIERDKFLHIKESNLEIALEMMEQLARTDGVGMIIIDSVKSFVSSVVENKSAFEETIGIEAKKWGARMSVISPLCERLDIPLIVLNQIRLNPGQMFGNPETIPGGMWQEHYPSLHIHVSKPSKGILVDHTGEALGITMKVVIKKTKYDMVNESDSFEVNLYTGKTLKDGTLIRTGGFRLSDEWFDLLVDADIISSKAGGNYTFPNGSKIKGSSNAKAILDDNPEFLNELIELYKNGKGPESTSEETSEDNEGVSELEE